MQVEFCAVYQHTPDPLSTDLPETIFDCGREVRSVLNLPSSYASNDEETLNGEEFSSFFSLNH